MSFRSLFIKLLVGSLVIGSAISIFIFLFGEFGDTESKILGSIASLGFFSLLGLCSSIIYEGGKGRRLSEIGMITAAAAFALSMVAIWDMFDMDYLGKPMIIAIVIAVAIAHAALLLRLNPQNDLVQKIRRATLVCVAILATLIILGVVFEFFDTNGYWRVIGVVAILDVLGTILVPILHHTLDKNSTANTDQLMQAVLSERVIS